MDASSSLLLFVWNNQQGPVWWDNCYHGTPCPSPATPPPPVASQQAGQEQRTQEKISAVLPRCAKFRGKQTWKEFAFCADHTQAVILPKGSQVLFQVAKAQMSQIPHPWQFSDRVITPLESSGTTQMTKISFANKNKTARQFFPFFPQHLPTSLLWSKSTACTGKTHKKRQVRARATTWPVPHVSTTTHQGKAQDWWYTRYEKIDFSAQSRANWSVSCWRGTYCHAGQGVQGAIPLWQQQWLTNTDNGLQHLKQSMRKQHNKD